MKQAGRCVAIYVRVSSKRQDQRSQIPDLERWESSQDQPTRWYTDKLSGRTMERTGWQKLEADYRAGKVSEIVCWRLDRLGRTAKGLTALFSDLIERKVNLRSIRESFDLSTPAGRLMANVLASVAQYETEVRAERVLAGQEAARATGKTWGGSQKGRRLKVTELQVETVKRLHVEEKPIAAIARTVGLSRPTVYAILREPA